MPELPGIQTPMLMDAPPDRCRKTPQCGVEVSPHATSVEGDFIHGAYTCPTCDRDWVQVWHIMALY